jgi:DNA adenine methylase
MEVVIMEEVNHSPISGFGSKYRACKEAGLHLYLPSFTSKKQIYVEPFCSSAVMFFNSNARSAVLNDKDNNIFNFWEVIRDKIDEFNKELKYTWNGTAWMEKYANRTDDIGRAVLFYLSNRISFTGIINDDFVYKYNVMRLEKDLSFWKKRFDSMLSLTIWNLDFHDLYEKFFDKGGESRSFVFYIDPPYVVQGGAYQEKMTTKDHEDLAAIHEKLREKENMTLLISYDDCPVVRELYKGWFIEEISWASVSIARKSEMYHELLVSNKEIVKRKEREITKQVKVL